VDTWPDCATPNPDQQRRQAIMRNTMRAVDAYLPKPYDGQVVSLIAEEEIFPLGGWQRAAACLRVERVPGNHNTCITTKVDALAARLRQALRAAQDAAGEQPGGGRAGPHPAYRSAAALTNP